MLAYFDCFSGISGDMTLGAFLDLGVPVDRLCRDLSTLPIGSFDLKAAPCERQGIGAMRCEVIATETAVSRHLADIQAIIGGSGFSGNVKQTALRIFDKLAVAEAGVHGCKVDEVHFHEVGAVDAIVDIVGCALCLEYLGITRIAVSPLPQGRGFVDSRHGRLPLPAPATLALLKGLPVHGVDIEGELVTPTGAAIVAALGETFGPMPPMTMTAVGYGAGQRTYASHPNLLRVILGKALENDRSSTRGYLSDAVSIIESTIDDMNPEFFGFLMEVLFEGGALDVYWIPVYMKKNRPATLVQVICHPDRVHVLRDILFKETTTIGLRVSTAGRWMLPRESITLDLAIGRVAIKRVLLPDGETRWVPEYEECRRIAREQDIPIRRAYEQIAGQAAALGTGGSHPPTDR